LWRGRYELLGYIYASSAPLLVLPLPFLPAPHTHTYPYSPSPHRYFSEGVVDPIAVVAGIVQTGLYLDFFYVYFTKYACFPPLPLTSPSLTTSLRVPRVLQGEKFELPA
jgi:hypothetical protein